MVPKDQRDTAQILVEKSDNDFEAISDKISSSLDSILRMDMVFYVDDGTKALRSSSRSMDELNGNTRRSTGYYGTPVLVFFAIFTILTFINLLHL